MKKDFEYLIVGAGPGGLQLGNSLQKRGRDYLIVEAGDCAGTFFKKFPRHRKLISINKVHTGHSDKGRNQRWDWNSLLTDDDGLLFKNYSKRYFPPADKMVDYLSEYVHRRGLNVKTQTRIKTIRKEGGRFHLTDQDGEVFTAAVLVVASGLFLPFIPDIPGIELCENYTDVTIDPESFSNQRVLIIGKGNSGFETADHLVENAAVIHLTSPNPVKFAWKTHHVGHLRAVNNNFLDTYLLKSQNGIWEAHISRIQKGEDGRFSVDFNLTRAHCATTRQVYDRILVCTGFRFQQEIFSPDCQPELCVDGRFPDQTCEWESTNIPNLFFAGTLMQARDFKKTQSSFIHGFRYNVNALSHILGIKYHGTPWPSTSFDLEIDRIQDRILETINNKASLWHQPGFLCDYIELDANQGNCSYFGDLPVDYLKQSDLAKKNDYLTISLEYGPDYPDFPFEFNRYTEPEDAHRNPQLHPIIRRYRNGELAAEHHIMEDVEGIWENDVYIKPLRAFLEAQFKVKLVS